MGISTVRKDKLL